MSRVSMEDPQSSSETSSVIVESPIDMNAWVIVSVAQMGFTSKLG